MMETVITVIVAVALGGVIVPLIINAIFNK